MYIYIYIYIHISLYIQKGIYFNEVGMCQRRRRNRPRCDGAPSVASAPLEADDSSVIKET